jgi:hypothetical protein
MKLRDALRALDVPVGFYSQKERDVVEAAVRRQYRKKMLDDHPDRGGDDNVAQLLNEALRVVLGDLDGLIGEDEQRHRERVLDFRQWASGHTGTGRSFDHCIWCLKKMRRQIGSVGNYVPTANGWGYQSNIERLEDAVTRCRERLQNLPGCADTIESISGLEEKIAELRERMEYLRAHPYEDYRPESGEYVRRRATHVVTAPYPRKGFNGNGVFCTKQCAVNYAIEKTCDLVDPYPQPVKIKWPDGMLPGTFEWGAHGYTPVAYFDKTRDHVRTDSQQRRLEPPEPDAINWHPDTRERLEVEGVLSLPEDEGVD